MSKNLVELMARRIAKSCPWLPINGEFRVAEYALEVVKEHIGEVAKSCFRCQGDGEEAYRCGGEIHYKECSECKGTGVIARTEGDV